MSKSGATWKIREMRETIRILQQTGRQLQATRAEQHLQDLQNQRTAIAERFVHPAEVLLALGSAHFRDGDRDAAEDEWKAAVAVNPKLGEAHNNLAVICMQTGRLVEAEQSLKLAEKAGFRVNPQFKDDLKEKMRRADWTGVRCGGLTPAARPNFRRA